MLPASISLSSASASPGDQLTLSGSSFVSGPNALITITASYPTNSSGESQTLTIDASASGTFTTVITVPSDTTTGTATITAWHFSGKSQNAHARVSGCCCTVEVGDTCSAAARYRD